MATEQKPKVIGVSCSPRKGGNTDILVQQVLVRAEEAGAGVEFVRVADMQIAPCDACWRCAETERCHINDDMQGIYPKLIGADGIVIGSPVHMAYNVSGQAQVFFDRTFPFWHRKMLRNKVGGSVTVANRRGTMRAIEIINSVFLAHDIVIAGYANGYGRNPGDVRKDQRAMREATVLGKRMCDLIRVLRDDIK